MQGMERHSFTKDRTPLILLEGTFKPTLHLFALSKVTFIFGFSEANLKSSFWI